MKLVPTERFRESSQGVEGPGERQSHFGGGVEKNLGIVTLEAKRGRGRGRFRSRGM